MKKLVDGQLVDMSAEESAAHTVATSSFQNNKYIEIAAWRDEQEQGSLFHTGRTWQADPVSRGRIESTLLGFSSTQTLPEGFFWTDVDNNDVPVTYAELQSLLAAIVAQGFAIHQRQRQLKLNLNNLIANPATTVEDIENFYVGW